LFDLNRCGISHIVRTDEQGQYFHDL